jgi:hypothetical protein
MRHRTFMRPLTPSTGVVTGATRHPIVGRSGSAAVDRGPGQGQRIARDLDSVQVALTSVLIVLLIPFVFWIIGSPRQ